MPYRRIAGLAALLAVAVFITPPLFAADPDVEFVLADAGEVRIPPRTLAPSDYVVAVYAERLQDLPVQAAKAPGSLAEGCLPLVSIETASGQDALSQPAELSFGCSDLPANAQIYAWVGNEWRPVPTARLEDGRALAQFTATTIYGLFLSHDVPRI